MTKDDGLSPTHKYLKSVDDARRKSVGPLNLDDISISPEYRKSHWQTACANGDWDKMDWNKMVEIFKDRIEGRFLKPIRLIANDRDIGGFSGFSILALDCLIIETLNQFYSGFDETKGLHEEAFWNFFKNSEFFKDHFPQEKKAFIFYRHIRCGILHQAQTKKKSVVRINQEAMIQSVEGDISESLIVDRSKFHDAVENEISSYMKRLKKGGGENAELRSNFVKKMNFICGEL
jgi:hypothetical protein